MNSTARSVCVTLFLLGAVAGSAAVSILTNPAGPIAASERSPRAVSPPQSDQLNSVRTVATLPAAAEETQTVPSENARQVSPTEPQPVPIPQKVTAGQTPAKVAVTAPGSPAAIGVRLSSDGLLPGRLNYVDPETGVRKPTKNLTISFLQGGKVVAQVKPGVSGVFQVKDLPVGLYSMIASGADGFLAMAVLVLPPLAAPSEASADDDPLQIDVDVVHPSNVPLVRMMIRERLYPSAPPAASLTKRIATESRLKERSKPLRTPTIQLEADGSLQTRFNWISPDAAGRTPAADSVAYLIRDGVIAAKSEVTADGIGRFAGPMTPGSYALLVAPAPTASVAPKDDDSSLKSARRGYGAMGIMVEPSESQNAVEVRDNSSPIRLVSALRRFQAPANSLVDIDLVPLEDIEGAVTGSSEGLGGDAAGLAGAPPPRAPAGGGGGGGAGGGSDITPLLVGGGIAGLLAVGSNLGTTNVSASASSSSSGGGGNGNGNGDGGGGSPKAVK